jgi:hypothetical protein
MDDQLEFFSLMNFWSLYLDQHLMFYGEWNYFHCVGVFGINGYIITTINLQIFLLVFSNLPNFLKYLNYNDIYQLIQVHLD